jgi:hypothetical protein
LDPRLRLPVPPADSTETQRADLPPGFGARSNGFAPHPATEPTFTNLTFRVRRRQAVRPSLANNGSSTASSVDGDSPWGSIPMIIGYRSSLTVALGIVERRSACHSNVPVGQVDGRQARQVEFVRQPDVELPPALCQ